MALLKDVVMRVACLHTLVSYNNLNNTLITYIIYRRTPMRKRDFDRDALFALRHGCSPVILLHVFRTNFYKSTYEGMLLYFQPTYHCFSFKAPSENKQLSVQLKTFEEIYFLSTITLKINPF